MADFLLSTAISCMALGLMAITAGLIVAIGILGNHLIERIIGNGK